MKKKEMNNMIDVNIKRIYPDEEYDLPTYETEGAAGMDVRAVFDKSLGCDRAVYPYETALIGTGLAVAIPEGYEIQVRPRSGLALRGIEVANSPGTIDSDYRGEIKVILKNTTDEMFYVNHGDRIAQLVLCPVSRCKWKAVSDLEDTLRGAGGFGSTGSE